jgi:hypothetical protein
MIYEENALGSRIREAASVFSASAQGLEDAIRAGREKSSASAIFGIIELGKLGAKGIVKIEDCFINRAEKRIDNDPSNAVTEKKLIYLLENCTTKELEEIIKEASDDSSDYAKLPPNYDLAKEHTLDEKLDRLNYLKETAPQIGLNIILILEGVSMEELRELYPPVSRKPQEVNCHLTHNFGSVYIKTSEVSN